VKKILTTFILSILLLSFVSAFDDIGTYKINECVTIRQSCSSCSYVNISISEPPSGNFNISNDAMNKIGGGAWNYSYCNTDTIGRYDIIGEGDISGVATSFNSMSFFISSTGEDLDISDAVLYLVMILFLCSLFGFLLYILGKIPRDIRGEDDFIIDVSKLAYLRPVVLGLCWILLTSIMFIVANIAVGFLTAGLIGKFLFTIFRLMGLSNLVIIPLCIIKMIQRIAMSKEMMGMIERGVEFR